MIISINDNLLDSSEAKLSIYDLGLNRGYAVFDYFKIVNGKFRFFEDHLDRFLSSIKLSKIKLYYTRGQIKEKITHLKEINHIENGYVRITMTAGDSDNFSTTSGKSKLIILVGEFPLANSTNNLNGEVLISKYYQRSVPQIKTTDYFFAQMHQGEMNDAQAKDILYYADCITETSRSNIFFVKNGALYTPKSNILAGITRKKVLSMYPNTKLIDITMEHLTEFDEAFICSSTKEIMPIIRIDDTQIGNGNVGPKVKEVAEGFKFLCTKRSS